ncbi:hypothetical protein ACFLTA_03975 [Bacteroidota bacterium]
MENALPYCGDLHIEAGTKKLILNLLSSIRSVVPVAGPPELHSPEDDPGLKSLDEIRNILLRARQHSDELEGVFSPDELLRYTRYVASYQDIISLMEYIIGELKVSRDSALRFASGMAELVEEHLHLTTPLRYCQAENPDGIKLKVV